jgi:hypothetical protein
MASASSFRSGDRERLTGFERQSRMHMSLENGEDILRGRGKADPRGLQLSWAEKNCPGWHRTGDRPGRMRVAHVIWQLQRGQLRDASTGHTGPKLELLREAGQCDLAKSLRQKASKMRRMRFPRPATERRNCVGSRISISVRGLH